MAVAERRWTASEIDDRLRAKFPSDRGEWVCVSELADGTGYSAKGRIDFFAINVWPSGRGRTVAVEIKVDRSDWRRELAKPSKRQFWEESCTEFWFAAPKGVIPVEELPAGAGLFETYGKGLRKARAAVQDFTRELDRHAWMSIARRAYEENLYALREARAQLDEFAEFAGRPVSVADLRRFASKLVAREEMESEKRVLHRHGAKKTLDDFLRRWGRVHQAIHLAVKAEGRQTATWKPTPDECLAWVQRVAAVGASEQDRKQTAQRLRKLADQIDPGT